jgi:DNA repair exonuclease SbcCD nuclease subunit
MPRFLHTSDWQIGISRAFLGEETGTRYAQARIEAVRRLARLAREEDCAFTVVAGDVFETNQVDRRTVSRLLEAMAGFPGPVYILPGNHDPLDPGSVYSRESFLQSKPPQVQVLRDAKPIPTPAGIEVVGAPWISKHPRRDLAAEALSALAPSPGIPRVLVAHGAVDLLAPDAEHPAVIRTLALEDALSRGVVSYVALGDRHSRTAVGTTGRIHYSGTPEVTDFDEVDPGYALVVEVDGSSVHVQPHRVGEWSFVREELGISGDADLDRLEALLAGRAGKELCVLRLGLRGTLSLRGRARLDGILEHARDLLAALDLWESRTDLAVLPEDGDFGDLGLVGFAAEAVSELRGQVARGGPEGELASAALGLLVRLARPEP